MNDKGLDSGLIREFDTNKRELRGQSKGFFGFRKMFTDYLTKLNVPFVDSCCLDLTGDLFPLRWNDETSVIERYNGTTWEEVQTIGGVSDNNISQFLLTENEDGLVEFNGPKMVDINNKNLTPLYSMPNGNITNEFDDMTHSGSMTTSTKTIVNGYDNIVVAGTNQDSYTRFPFIVTHNRTIYRLKIRVGAVGATAPVIGFRNIYVGSTYSNFNTAQFYGYFNLATGAVTATASGTTVLTTYNGFAGTVVANDIIELELQIENMRPRTLKITKSNLLTGEFSVTTQLKNITADGEAVMHHPAIIMADGTYQVLSYEIFSMDNEPFILLDGDSMGVGVRISYADSVAGKLESKIPYRVASQAAGTKLLRGHLATMWQFNKIRPTYLPIFHYLESCQGYANPANGNHATWSANFTKYISTIKAMGIIPIFVYPQTWAVIDSSGANSAFYETYLNTNYPSDLKVKVLTSESFYDATGFHYNGVTNGIIADKIIALLTGVL